MKEGLALSDDKLEAKLENSNAGDDIKVREYKFSDDFDDEDELDGDREEFDDDDRG